MIINFSDPYNVEKEKVKEECEKIYKCEKAWVRNIKFEIIESGEKYKITAYIHMNVFVYFIAQFILLTLTLLGNTYEAVKESLLYTKKIFQIKKPKNQYSIKKVMKEFGVKE